MINEIIWKWAVEYNFYNSDGISSSDIQELINKVNEHQRTILLNEWKYRRNIENQEEKKEQECKTEPTQ